jgi:hypothetical protein
MKSKGILMRALLTLMLAIVAFSAHAADRYVRPGATGNGSGTDWANAYTSLPASLVRGDTYWIAAGNYGSRTFKDPHSGTTPITIRKATASAHGTDTGWSASYADGQAVFAGMMFDTGYYVIDGATRNESNWADSNAYGIRNTGALYSNRFNSSTGNCADGLTFRYIDVGAAVGTGSSSATSSGVYLGGFGGGSTACENWTLHRSHVHNTKIHVQCAGCSGLLVEYTYFGTGWGKEAIRGQNYTTNSIIRHSVFKDSCQRDPADSTSGCTAEIALWDGEAFDGNEVYGNVFYKTTSEHNCCGVVVIGGNGTSWVGPATNNSKVFNNTVVGIMSGNASILINGGSGNACRNNLWYGNASGVPTGCSANAASNNVAIGSSIFANAAGGDFRLTTATSGGFALASPYDVDMRGVKRATDGVWDIGAFEFTATGAVVLPPPLNLNVF